MRPAYRPGHLPLPDRPASYRNIVPDTPLTSILFLPIVELHSLCTVLLPEIRLYIITSCPLLTPVVTYIRVERLRRAHMGSLYTITKWPLNVNVATAVVAVVCSFALAACQSQVTPSATAQSSQIRPPDWIHGTWVCSAGFGACIGALGFIFRENEIRQFQESPSTNAVIPADTQTATSDSYVVTSRLQGGGKRVHRFTRTMSGFTYETKTTGFIESSAGPFPYVRYDRRQ